jgi:hypothetical protein
VSHSFIVVLPIYHQDKTQQGKLELELEEKNKTISKLEAEVLILPLSYSLFLRSRG